MTSSSNKNIDSDKWVQWIEDGISKYYINCHEYDEFQDIEPIGSGAFGEVNRATWKSTNSVVALKSFKNDSCIMKEIVNELRLLNAVHSHANIIRFFGIIKKKYDNKNPDYLFILEYADGGTLRSYLKDNFNKLDWNMKLQFAVQIADAVSCIHQNNIIHRDLHSNNILVNQNMIKLADFGLSRRLVEVSNTVKDIFGMVPYIDPQHFKKQTNGKHYRSNKKSDVYSVGVLLWEISSGQKPFGSYDESCFLKAALLCEISNGKRETPISDTPIDYIDIYERCWQDNPDDRPDIQQVFSDLKDLKLINLYINEIQPLSTSENINTSEDNIVNTDPLNYSDNLIEEMQQMNINLMNTQLIVQENEENKSFTPKQLSEKEELQNETNALKDESLIKERGMRRLEEKLEKANKGLKTYQNEEELGNQLHESGETKSSTANPKAEESEEHVKELQTRLYELETKLLERPSSYELEAAKKTAAKQSELVKELEIKLASMEQFSPSDANINSIAVVTAQLNDAKYAETMQKKGFEAALKEILHQPSNSLYVMRAIVPFTKFLPLISEVERILNEVKNIEQAAEHNKRTCHTLLQRVYAANLAVFNLKINHQDNQEFFNSKNYLYLQNLVNVVTQIKRFITEISQMVTLLKYIQMKSIERTFKELCEEFDSCIVALTFTVAITSSDGLEHLRADQEDLNKYLKEIDVVGSNTKEFKVKFSENFSSTVLKVNVMNNTMEQLMNDQNQIDAIFQVHKLKSSDYEMTDEKPRKGERVTKWVNIRNKSEEFAFKRISDNEDQRIIQNQVTILKELHNWQNIIKFYGLTYDGNKWYLVTEWAEYGNLREFYTNHKSRVDLRLKLRIACDIACGLNFLRNVKMVHRDIRSENILITLNETAKLANFKLSRYLNANTLKQSQNLERVRYCAPELLERSPDYKYDQRCEVYSFGILLWEIAEERIPYQDNRDILELTDLVRHQMYREPFSVNSSMPESYKQLETDAVCYDPDFRPKISTMFNVLCNCFEELNSNSSQTKKYTQPKPIPRRSYSVDQDAYSTTDLPNFESFKYMTLTEAEKQHKIVDKSGRIIGDIRTAYKCFEAYANLSDSNTRRSQIKAKYYKAYYISRGLVDGPEEKDKIVAELFKEVADDDANEFPGAKLRYADCLYNGKGVEKDYSEALKYFEKAAEDGFKVAMYNVGNLYYNGIGCEKDIEKANHYIRLAAYNGYEHAIKFCKDNNINL